ncbi:sn-glycerol-3-phosphate ABC transporter ATP-binding protein UgpC [Diaphorobacter sp. HDW4A]|uniref:ABC transporter ATP-binding protein n=1 Tax=Diaphorobacter sp. HDW4A TaxID=2714924 RepID=UPI001407DFB4|nr:sn-glycerol-3-phosphate ABC transporter ATP-binding protein UgpC [Diaphorobacter sp. HDW4A]QIL80371.1 sn-glycerol-3-phosphate ABC transporter ATP-binding protein UgpC [Diaphorobacter sp. HDW4A]
MASISIRQVHKQFQGQDVLKGISLDIRDGEFVALVGPSGCGKSTLLRILAGLESVSSGEITLGGKRINDVPPRDRNIAMVFQNYALYPHLSVAENLGFALKLQRKSPAQIRERVNQVAEILGLSPLLERLPGQLSGGQRQRVAMGRAIIREPDAFLFDEPLSNLDAKLRVQMRTEIKALHQRLRTTTVYVTHDQVEAMTMADRIVVMRDGVIEQSGTPLELYDRPRNAFVAQFIGSPSMNLIAARTHNTDSGLRLVTDDGLQLPVPEQWSLPHDNDIWLGIRPEHLRIAQANAAHNSWPAITEVVEPTGADTQIVSRLGQHQVISVANERIQLQPGEPLHLQPQASALHIFDRESGRRLN